MQNEEVPRNIWFPWVRRWQDELLRLAYNIRQLLQGWGSRHWQWFNSACAEWMAIAHGLNIVLLTLEFLKTISRGQPIRIRMFYPIRMIKIPGKIQHWSCYKQSNILTSFQKISIRSKEAWGNTCALLIMCSGSCRLWQHTLYNIEWCRSTSGDQRTS